MVEVMDPDNEPHTIAGLAKDKYRTSCMYFVSEVREPGGTFLHGLVSGVLSVGQIGV